MNYKKFINNKNILHDRSHLLYKSFFSWKINKKDAISVAYHEYDKEEIRLEQYNGYCLKFRSCGLNSKLVLSSRFDKNKVILNFFYYNPYLFDIGKDSSF
jgi:ribosomal protein L19